MENKINKTEQQELKNKEFLKKIEDKNISNITFKAEGLGALDFKTIERPFRIERVSTDTFFKLSSEKDELAIGKKLLNTFIAHPTEARDIEFFNMDQEALETITVIITEFQQTPFLFIKNFGENKEN